MRRWDGSALGVGVEGLFRGGLGRLADRGIDARHDFLGHQLHRALGERRVDPVHAGIDQFAEIAGLLVQLEDLRRPLC